MTSAATGLAPLQEHGFCLLGRLFTPHTLEALRIEARRLHPTGSRCVERQHRPNEQRGGRPRRAFHMAPGGGTQHAAMRDPRIGERLDALAGRPLTPLGAGTYSFYEAAGDHLGLHRDEVGCEATLLTCLEHTAPSRRGCLLVAWPDRRLEGLAQIATTPDRGPQALQIAPGHSVLLLGGEIAHAVLPSAPGERRSMAVVCFDAAGVGA